MNSKTRILLTFLLTTLFGLNVHAALVNRLCWYASLEQSEGGSWEDHASGDAFQETEGDGPDDGQDEKLSLCFRHFLRGSYPGDDFWYFHALYCGTRISLGTLSARLPVRYFRPGFFILYHSFKAHLLL